MSAHDGVITALVEGPPLGDAKQRVQLDLRRAPSLPELVGLLNAQLVSVDNADGCCRPVVLHPLTTSIAYSDAATGEWRPVVSPAELHDRIRLRVRAVGDDSVDFGDSASPPVPVAVTPVPRAAAADDDVEIPQAQPPDPATFMPGAVGVTPLGINALAAAPPATSPARESPVSTLRRPKSAAPRRPPPAVETNGAGVDDDGASPEASNRAGTERTTVHPSLLRDAVALAAALLHRVAREPHRAVTAAELATFVWNADDDTDPTALRNGTAVTFADVRSLQHVQDAYAAAIAEGQQQQHSLAQQQQAVREAAAAPLGSAAQRAAQREQELEERCAALEIELREALAPTAADDVFERRLLRADSRAAMLHLLLDADADPAVAAAAVRMRAATVLNKEAAAVPAAKRPGTAGSRPASAAKLSNDASRAAAVEAATAAPRHVRIAQEAPHAAARTAYDPDSHPTTSSIRRADPKLSPQRETQLPHALASPPRPGTAGSRGGTSATVPWEDPTPQLNRGIFATDVTVDSNPPARPKTAGSNRNSTARVSTTAIPAPTATTMTLPKVNGASRPEPQPLARLKPDAELPGARPQSAPATRPRGSSGHTAPVSFTPAPADAQRGAVCVDHVTRVALFFSATSRGGRVDKRSRVLLVAPSKPLTLDRAVAVASEAFGIEEDAVRLGSTRADGGGIAVFLDTAALLTYVAKYPAGTMPVVQAYDTTRPEQHAPTATTGARPSSRNRPSEPEPGSGLGSLNTTPMPSRPTSATRTRPEPSSADPAPPVARPESAARQRYVPSSVAAAAYSSVSPDTVDDDFFDMSADGATCSTPQVREYLLERFGACSSTAYLDSLLVPFRRRGTGLRLDEFALVVMKVAKN